MLEKMVAQILLPARGRCLASLAGAFLAALAIFPAPVRVYAQDASSLSDLTIARHYFTTEFRGRNGDGRRATDPNKARFLVLRLNGTLPKQEGRLFCNDFVLRCWHSDGREDRAQCEAIGADEDRLGVGSNASSTTVLGPAVTFDLVFMVEPDVEAVNLHRLSAREPLLYQIGTDRPTSVYITTNREPAILSPVEQVISSGGYNVVETSTRLAGDERDATIYYAERAEVHAREISQRLMTALGTVPAVKRSDLVTTFDIVVWIGSETSRAGGEAVGAARR